MTQTGLFDTQTEQAVMSEIRSGSLQQFGGATYEPIHDEKRLTGQLERVKSVVLDGKWRTVSTIQKAIQSIHGKHDTEGGIGARLRDLRKAQFGGYTVNRRRSGDPASGHFEYQVEA